MKRTLWKTTDCLFVWRQLSARTRCLPAAVTAVVDMGVAATAAAVIQEVTAEEGVTVAVAIVEALTSVGAAVTAAAVGIVAPEAVALTAAAVEVVGLIPAAVPGVVPAMVLAVSAGMSASEGIAAQVVWAGQGTVVLAAAVLTLARAEAAGHTAGSAAVTVVQVPGVARAMSSAEVPALAVGITAADTIPLICLTHGTTTDIGIPILATAGAVTDGEVTAAGIVRWRGVWGVGDWVRCITEAGT